MNVIATDEDRRKRLIELREADEKAAEEQAEKRKNRGFTQVYQKGWHRLQELMKDHPMAARIYAFLAENIGDAGSVVASQEYLAHALDVHLITIRRNTEKLEKMGAVVRIRVGSGVYAYCLDPEEVWRSWDDKKDTAAFNSRTLVSKRDKDNGRVSKLLKTMYIESKE